MTQQSDASTGATGSPSLIDALTEVIDLLNEHPELPPRSAFVYLDATERADLEAVAAALGDRATEELGYTQRSVEIKGQFEVAPLGPYVTVIASVPIERLEPEVTVKPKYRPILSNLDAVTGEGRR